MDQALIVTGEVWWVTSDAGVSPPTGSAGEREGRGISAEGSSHLKSPIAQTIQLKHFVPCVSAYVALSLSRGLM